MKNLFLSLVVIFMFGLSAFAEVILAPQWSEFCPVSYLTAKESKLNKSANYWYVRRIQFEESLKMCDKYKGEDLKSCYSQISSAEYNKNKAWNNMVESQERLHQEHLERQKQQQTINAFTDIVKNLSK